MINSRVTPALWPDDDQSLDLDSLLQSTAEQAQLSLKANTLGGTSIAPSFVPDGNMNAYEGGKVGSDLGGQRLPPPMVQGGAVAKEVFSFALGFVPGHGALERDQSIMRGLGQAADDRALKLQRMLVGPDLAKLNKIMSDYAGNPLARFRWIEHMFGHLDTGDGPRAHASQDFDLS